MHSAQKISGAALTQIGPKQCEQHDNASAPSGREKQLQLQTVLSRTTLGSREEAADSLQNAIRLKKKKHAHVSEDDFATGTCDSRCFLSQYITIVCSLHMEINTQDKTEYLITHLWLIYNCPIAYTSERLQHNDAFGRQKEIRSYPS